MISPKIDKLIDAATDVLFHDDRVVFAYLYGTIVSDGKGNDIDIAVFQQSEADAGTLPVDLKIDLHQKAGNPPDDFDVRILNGIIEKGDVFTLLYLRNILEEGRLLVNKDEDMHADFIERYGYKYCECAGLISEVLA